MAAGIFFAGQEPRRDQAKQATSNPKISDIILVWKIG